MALQCESPKHTSTIEALVSVVNKMNVKALIGDRLREERRRLGLNQDALGVTPQSQRKYEKGERAPDAEYLAGFAALGGDVRYVITGTRSAGEEEGVFLNSDEATMLDLYRGIPEDKRAAVFDVMRAMAIYAPAEVARRNPQPRRATGLNKKREGSGS